MKRIAVIGAGSWGTTVACLIARVTPVILWARRPELAEAINQGENPDYLPGYRLPYGLRATSRLEEAVAEADAVIVGVPSHGFRSVLAKAAPHLTNAAPIVSLTKGIEEQSMMRMTEVIAEVAPAHDPELAGVLTGPNLSKEIAQGHPAAAVIAMRNREAALELQRLLMGPTLRIYTNPDVVGCEVAGAVKNVMAIAAGMSDGLGFGDNAKAALITRALAEMTRLGVALGGEPSTFAGLAGMGDLIATCQSRLSRNHLVGVELARGRRLAEILEEMRMVAEGVKTTRAVLAMAERLVVEMPIAAQVGRVLYDGAHPREAVMSLMTREAKAEH
jgi:glycerol-3-phosphate dehydrogenase (NAD(P)+)